MNNTCDEFKLLHVVEMPRLLELVQNITDHRFLIVYSVH